MEMKAWVRISFFIWNNNQTRNWITLENEHMIWSYSIRMEPVSNHLTHKFGNLSL